MEQDSRTHYEVGVESSMHNEDRQILCFTHFSQEDT